MLNFTAIHFEKGATFHHSLRVWPMKHVSLSSLWVCLQGIRPCQIGAWLVHCFTALGAVLGLLMLVAIVEGAFLNVFWLMGGAILIDSVDGTLARRLQVKRYAGKIDGITLDNIIDYLNYVVVPAFLLTQTELLPAGLRLLLPGLIVLVSAYQFSQVDAKTGDHFFKGFPSYWNVIVFYLFLWQMAPALNAAILGLLALLIFVPIKYIYPSRLDYFSSNRWLRRGMLALTLLWGAATVELLRTYPSAPRVVTLLSLAYIADRKSVV